MYANPLDIYSKIYVAIVRKKIVLIVCEKDLKHRIHLCNMFVFLFCLFTEKYPY